MITFFVPGEPKGLKRHRTGKFGTYDPSKGDKADFLILAMENKPKRPYECALSVTIRAYFTRPKSHYGTGKNATKTKKGIPVFHAKKPDADNVSKFVLDALNGVFWRDDSQVAELTVLKCYVSDCGIMNYIGPGIEIEIDAIDGEGIEYFGIKSKEHKK